MKMTVLTSTRILKRECQRCGKKFIAHKEPGSRSTTQRYCEKCWKRNVGSNHKKKIKRKVVCVFGKWGTKTDFVLEPACSDKCKCDLCKDAFWVEEVLEIKANGK